METDENLLTVIWRGKWLIIAVTFLAAILSVMTALSMPDKYRAEILLAPAETTSGSGLGGLTSQLGGLAGLAGISGLSGESNKVGEALALLKSRAFIQGFISRRQLLPELLATESLDKESGLLKLDPTKYDVESNTWVRTPPKGKEVVPSAWEGFDAFTQQLTIEDDNSDGTIILTIESLSPKLAKHWLEWLVKDLNQFIAEKELSEARRSIVFLEQQIANTQVQELHNIFYSLIEEQTKKIMLGETRDDYVFKVLAEPVLPEEKSGPSRALICIGGTFFGGILAIFLVTILNILGLAFRRGR